MFIPFVTTRIEEAVCLDSVLAPMLSSVDVGHTVCKAQRLFLCVDASLTFCDCSFPGCGKMIMMNANAGVGVHVALPLPVCL